MDTRVVTILDSIKIGDVVGIELCELTLEHADGAARVRKKMDDNNGMRETYKVQGDSKTRLRKVGRVARQRNTLALYSRVHHAWGRLSLHRRGHESVP